MTELNRVLGRQFHLLTFITAKYKKKVVVCARSMTSSPLINWLLALCLAAALPGLGADRQLRIRDLPDAPQAGCDNTVGSRWYVADDQGRVCPREAFDSSTGCCSKAAKQHQCDTCDADDQCCSSYEHCVSCCMGPSGGAGERMRSAPRGFNKPETGLWASAFEYCRGTCRTTSRSTQHENAFILDRRFCFSETGRPLEGVPPAPPLPASIAVVAGQAGRSCDDACKEQKSACAPAHFAALNDCNSMRARFPCEAGCRAGQPSQLHFPGYVDSGSPKELWPAMCFLLGVEQANGTTLESNCSVAADHVRRLCPCEVVPEESSQVDAAESTQGASSGLQDGKQSDSSALQQQQQQQQAAEGASSGGVQAEGGAEASGNT